MSTFSLSTIPKPIDSAEAGLRSSWESLSRQLLAEIGRVPQDVKGVERVQAEWMARWGILMVSME
jgi:hypothetical protein